MHIDDELRPSPSESMMSTHPSDRSPEDFKVELLKESGGGLFFIRLAEGAQSFLRFKVEGAVMVIEAVLTPEEFRGRGLAAKLMDEAVKYAEKHGYRVLPKCSYAEYYFKKHPEKKMACLEP